MAVVNVRSGRLHKVHQVAQTPEQPSILQKPSEFWKGTLYRVVQPARTPREGTEQHEENTVRVSLVKRWVGDSSRTGIVQLPSQRHTTCLPRLGVAQSCTDRLTGFTPGPDELNQELKERRNEPLPGRGEFWLY